MLLKDFLPARELIEFVRCYRIVHFSFGTNSPTPIKAYPPRPEHCLAFYPRDTEKAEYAKSGKQMHHFRTSLTGQQTELINRQVGNDFIILQIVFQPTGLYRLTGIPSSELTNQYLDGALVFPNVHLINEQLYHAKTYDEMLDISNKFVHDIINSRKIKDRHGIDEISKLLLHQNDCYSLDKLADQSCLCTKQFERKFNERTGVMPKIFSRIARFDRAFRMKNRNPKMDWMRIAVECGYYDYQHLVKDYRKFTSYTPTRFHIIEDQAPERSLGLSEAWYRHSID
jgi:AraC-like DNA-binding protein